MKHLYFSDDRTDDDCVMLAGRMNLIWKVPRRWWVDMTARWIKVFEHQDGVIDPGNWKLNTSGILQKAQLSFLCVSWGTALVIVLPQWHWQGLNYWIFLSSFSGIVYQNKDLVLQISVLIRKRLRETCVPQRSGLHKRTTVKEFWDTYNFLLYCSLNALHPKHVKELDCGGFCTKNWWRTIAE